LILGVAVPLRLLDALEPSTTWLIAAAIAIAAAAAAAVAAAAALGLARRDARRRRKADEENARRGRTEDALASEALRHSEQRYRDLFQHLPVAMLRFNAQERSVLWQSLRAQGV
jgi:PAS domain-containing protein